MEERTMPIEDLILFLENIQDQVKHVKSYKMYLKRSALDSFYDEFGDIQKEDGTIEVNTLRTESIAKLLSKEGDTN